MKKITTIILLLFVQITTVVAQDTTYYKGDDKVSKLDDYDWFEYVVKDNSDSTISVKYAFYKTGKKKYEIEQKLVRGNLYQKDYTARHGICKYWHENGKIQQESTCKNDIMVSKLLTYYENGNKKREDEYNEKGEKIFGYCYDINGKAIKWYPYQIPAEYPGGMTGVNNLILENLRYPPKAYEYKIEGKVFVQFVIDTDGTPIEFKVVKGVSPELDEEALRVFKMMSKWKCSLQDGVPVRQKMTVPVKFKIG